MAWLGPQETGSPCSWAGKHLVHTNTWPGPLSPRQLLLPPSAQPFVSAGLTSATVVGFYKISSLPELPHG